MSDRPLHQTFLCQTDLVQKLVQLIKAYQRAVAGELTADEALEAFLTIASVLFPAFGMARDAIDTLGDANKLAGAVEEEFQKRLKAAAEELNRLGEDAREALEEDILDEVKKEVEGAIREEVTARGQEAASQARQAAENVASAAASAWESGKTLAEWLFVPDLGDGIPKSVPADGSTEAKTAAMIAGAIADIVARLVALGLHVLQPKNARIMCRRGEEDFAKGVKTFESDGICWIDDDKKWPKKREDEGRDEPSRQRPRRGRPGRDRRERDEKPREPWIKKKKTHHEWTVDYEYLCLDKETQNADDTRADQAAQMFTTEDEDGEPDGWVRIKKEQGAAVPQRRPDLQYTACERRVFMQVVSENSKDRKQEIIEGFIEANRKIEEENERIRLRNETLPVEERKPELPLVDLTKIVFKIVTVKSREPCKHPDVEWEAVKLDEQGKPIYGGATGKEMEFEAPKNWPGDCDPNPECPKQKKKIERN